MPLTVGRLSLGQPSAASSSSSSDSDTLSLSGRLLSREEGSPAAADRRRRDVLALNNELVPISWPEGHHHGGFYTVTNATAEVEKLTAAANLIRWSLQLTRLGGTERVEFESRLTGGTIPNDHAVTGERWHAPPPGHRAYYLGITAPGSISRVGATSTVTVYRNLPALTTSPDPLWALAAPGDLYNAAATVTVDTHPLVGADPPTPTTVTLSNDLIAVTVPGTDVLTVSRSKPATFSRDWRVLVNDAIIPEWRLATVLRNDPEQVAVRLYAPGHAVRLTLDVTVTRGARYVSFYARRAAAATFRIARSTTETGSTATPGVLVSSATTDGDRWVVGSARTFTAFSASGGIARAANVDMDFFVGEEIGGTGAQAGDTAGALLAQYLGEPSVTDVPVRR